MQNKIIKGKDNPLSFDFVFTGDFANNGLSNFTRIEIIIGNESYNSIDNPELFNIEDTKLDVSLGTVTFLAVGYYDAKIVGFNATYDDGYCLTAGNRLPVQVVSGC